LSHDHEHGHDHVHGHSHEHSHEHEGDRAWNGETARWYAERYGDWPTHGLTAQRLELSGDEVVLDVGCGTGSMLRAVLPALTGGRALGVDPVEEMVGIARSQTSDERITYHRGPAEALPIQDASVDLAMTVNSLHHFTDPLAGLLEMKRALRPGGVVLVVTDEEMYDMLNWSNGRVRDLLTRAGFRQIRQDSAHAGSVVANLLFAVKPA
jgi:SAM-dependent methyltransferase